MNTCFQCTDVTRVCVCVFVFTSGFPETTMRQLLRVDTGSMMVRTTDDMV